MCQDIEWEYLISEPEDRKIAADSEDYYESVGRVWFICASYYKEFNRISVYFEGFTHHPEEPVEGELVEMTLHELLHWADEDASEEQVHPMAYKLTWNREFQGDL